MRDIKFRAWDYDDEQMYDDSQIVIHGGTSFVGKIKYIHQISEDVFRVESFEINFFDIYNEITQYQMYEGLVLKLKTGKLENGIGKDNNTKTQFKSRKSTKNYSF